LNDSFSPGITTFPLNLSVANITFVALLALLDAKLVLNDAIKSGNASAVIESVVTAGYNVFNFILYSILKNPLQTMSISKDNRKRFILVNFPTFF